jgi:outer membrane protein
MGFTSARAAVLLWILLSSVPALAQEQKIAGLNLREMMLRTKEGQQERAALEKKYSALEQQLSRSRVELDALKTRLNAERDRLSEAERSALAGEIEAGAKLYNRALEDAQEDLRTDEERLFSRLTARVIPMIERYAETNGYSLVFDTSSPEVGLLHIAEQIDIGDAIVREYDSTHPAASSGTEAIIGFLSDIDT